MKTICCLLLTVVMAGVAVGEDLDKTSLQSKQHPVVPYQRSVGGELATLMNNYATFLSLKQSNQYRVLVEVNLFNSRELLVDVFHQSGEGQYSYEDAKDMEKLMVDRLRQILYSMSETKQPASNDLIQWYKSVDDAAMDGTYEKRVAAGDFYDNCPYKLIVREHQKSN